MADTRQIAFLCHPYHRGGVTRWMADAAIALSRKGHSVWFITVEPNKPFFSAKGRETLVQLLAKEENTVQVIKARVGYEFEFGTPAYREFVYRRLLAKLPPGTPVILSDDHVVWSAAATLHGTYPVVGVLHADEEQYYHLAEKYFRSAEILTCVSRRVHETVSKRVPAFAPEHTFTIPCGINLPPAPSGNSSGDIIQLVYVGRVSIYQKRAVDLARICEVLARNNVPFHLTVIGDGDAKAPLQDAVTAAGLSQHVTFAGWRSQSEVAQYLSESDVLLLTSDFEGTPIAMMEALAAGCGMVGTRVSGIEDYEFHPLAKDCLGVYAVGDYEDAAKHISRVAAVPRHIRQGSARNLAESEFSMQVCLNRYLTAIKTISHQPTTLPHISLPTTDLIYSKAIALARHTKVSLTRK